MRIDFFQNMVVITKEELKKNYERHLDKFTNCPAPLDFPDNFLKLEVTHTFPESRDGVAGKLWREIFLNHIEEHRGLLSYECRKKNNLLHDEGKPEGVVAEKFGLYGYVFAYLGAHESYYANKGVAPAFGVFISREIEKEDTSNASCRDIAILGISIDNERELTDDEIKRIKGEFLFPEDARKIITYEISKNYDGDIWKYWKSSWENKVEMHFFEKVHIDNIKGIIWPVRKYRKLGGRIDISYYHEQFMDFAKECPHIKIYQYDWTPKYGHKAFQNASYRISEYFFKHGKYPDNCKIEYEP